MAPALRGHHVCSVTQAFLYVQSTEEVSGFTSSLPSSGNAGSIPILCCVTSPSTDNVPITDPGPEALAAGLHFQGTMGPRYLEPGYWVKEPVQVTKLTKGPLGMETRCTSGRCGGKASFSARLSPATKAFQGQEFLCVLTGLMPVFPGSREGQ